MALAGVCSDTQVVVQKLSFKTGTFAKVNEMEST